MGRECVEEAVLAHLDRALALLDAQNVGGLAALRICQAIDILRPGICPALRNGLAGLSAPKLGERFSDMDRT